MRTRASSRKGLPRALLRASRRSSRTTFRNYRGFCDSASFEFAAFRSATCPIAVDSAGKVGRDPPSCAISRRVSTWQSWERKDRRACVSVSSGAWSLPVAAAVRSLSECLRTPVDSPRFRTFARRANQNGSSKSSRLREPSTDDVGTTVVRMRRSDSSYLSECAPAAAPARGNLGE